MSEQLEAILKGMETVNGSVATLGRRLDGTNTKIDTVKSSVDSLTSRVKKLEDVGGGRTSLTKEEKDRTIKCNNCNKIGHREADCPDR